MKKSVELLVFAAIAFLLCRAAVTGAFMEESLGAAKMLIAVAVPIALAALGIIIGMRMGAGRAVDASRVLSKDQVVKVSSIHDFNPAFVTVTMHPFKEETEPMLIYVGAHNPSLKRGCYTWTGKELRPSEER